MPTAEFNSVVIAKSDRTEVVEGNHYFRPDSLVMKFFEPSSHTSVCPWKGTASYYDVVVGEKRSEAAAWYYPEAKEAAKRIQGYVAFWRGVTVTD